MSKQWILNKQQHIGLVWHDDSLEIWRDGARWYHVAEAGHPDLPGDAMELDFDEYFWVLSGLSDAPENWSEMMREVIVSTYGQIVLNAWDETGTKVSFEEAVDYARLLRSSQPEMSPSRTTTNSQPGRLSAKETA